MTARRSASSLAIVALLLIGAADPSPWAFRPVARPEVPRVEGATHPIDAFLARRLERDGLRRAPEADRRTLLRRLSFDLVGLPPSPEETAAFLADAGPDAYEKLVDRLLASPHHGERWGRHWLDLVRYAETNGYERDDPKPNAWKYRDWVISALNRNVPYDRFLAEQIAGDELPDATDESRTATGMYRLGPIDDEPADPVADRFDQIDDMIKTVGTTMLGLSIHCARCHDHKFDPISQADYYRMAAFFTPSKPFVKGQDESISLVLTSDSERSRVADLESGLARNAERIKARIEALRAPHRRAGAEMSEDEAAQADARMLPSEKALRQDLEKSLARLERYRPTGFPMVLGLTDSGVVAAPTHVMARGDAHKPGKEVGPGFPSRITKAAPLIVPPRSGATTGRRLALARWIASPENPLTARVLVNRLWQHHFGRGLVATPSDFGAMGEEPSHPALLDWLASEFVASNWDLKAMHRLMVTSAAYRRSGSWDAPAAATDPDDALLWRFAPRRLQAEPIRDAVLFVSGALDPAIGGPSVMPEIDRSVLAGQSRPGNGWKTSPAKTSMRRSVYVKVKRTLAVPELDVLDAAEPNEPCPSRSVTTTAPQALTLLNSAFMHDQARQFADRLARETGDDPSLRVDRAFALAFARKPSGRERADSVAFLAGQAERISSRAGGAADPAREALASFCLAILNANEFVMID